MVGVFVADVRAVCVNTVVVVPKVIVICNDADGFQRIPFVYKISKVYNFRTGCAGLIGCHPENGGFADGERAGVALGVAGGRGAIGGVIDLTGAGKGNGEGRNTVIGTLRKLCSGRLGDPDRPGVGRTGCGGGEQIKGRFAIGSAPGIISGKLRDHHIVDKSVCFCQIELIPGGRQIEG